MYSNQNRQNLRGTGATQKKQWQRFAKKKLKKIESVTSSKDTKKFAEQMSWINRIYVAQVPRKKKQMKTIVPTAIIQMSMTQFTTKGGKESF